MAGERSGRAKTAAPGARGVLRVSGENASGWLQGLVTNDVEAIPAGEARFAALLTPQGKIIADFLVTPDGDGLLLDCAADQAGPLAKRLAMYRLRAPIEIADLSGSLAIAAFWDGEPPAASKGRIFADPRHERLGWRVIAPPDELDRLADDPAVTRASEDEWRAHRIACGAPQGGVDFPWGDTFPHEANMDRLGGLDFHKGCYVGQEVVSRVQHRGLARKRVTQVRIAGAAPPPGAEILAGEITVGTMGSSAGEEGLAMLRLDRAEEAIAAGHALTASGAGIFLCTPAHDGAITAP